MNKYQHGKIYKIVDNTNDQVYVGSTCQKRLSQRLNDHVRHYKDYLIGKFNYVSSFEIFKNNNYDIILLETVQCETRDELRARERHYIETLSCVNKRVEGRTKKEYYEANKEDIKEYQREWRIAHKDELKEYQKEWNQQHKEEQREKQRAYKEKNKELIRQKRREYNLRKKQLTPSCPSNQ